MEIDARSDIKNSYRNHLALWGAYALFICAYIAALLPFTGGPQTWDELLYLDLSLNTKADPTVLFRYGHIYLQKLFLLFIPANTILASKIFWLFITGTTLWLTGLTALRISGKSILALLFAVYFFLLQNLVYQKYTGVTYADFTVMFLGACMLAVFFSRRQDNSKLFLLSLLFVFAFKTKETSLPFGILPLALFLDKNYSPQYSRWKPVLLALVSGMALFMILDAIYLHDAFFSMSLSSMQKRADFDMFTVFQRTTDNWMLYLFRSTLIFPFLLYLKSVFSLKGMSFSGVLATCIPLACLLFLVFTMITGSWGIEDRYILPAIPFICVFSAQTFASKDQDHAPKPIVELLIVAGIGALCLIIEKITSVRSAHYGWNRSTFHYGILLPLSIIAFFMILIFRGHMRPNVFRYALLAPVLFYTLPDLKGNLIVLGKKDCLKASEKRFHPFEFFRQELSETNGKTLLVSNSLFEHEQLLARDQKSLSWMYNIYFNTSKASNELIYKKPAAGDFPKYDILLLHKTDSEVLNDSIVNGNYDKKTDGNVILLTRKTNA